MCTGNTCRSSVAEALLNDITKDEKKELDINVYSRGLSAVDGSKASIEAIKIMKEYGIDLSNHRAKSVTREDVEKADLILTMTNEHKVILLNIYENTKNKIYTLKEFAYGDKDLNIEDPFGQSQEVYRNNADEIKGAIEKVLDKLKSE